MFENRSLEIIIIAVVVLVLFGSKRLPDAARSLGKSLRILKTETHALRTDADNGGPEPVPEPVPDAARPTLVESTEQAAPTGHATGEQAATGVNAPH